MDSSTVAASCLLRQELKDSQIRPFSILHILPETGRDFLTRLDSYMFILRVHLSHGLMAFSIVFEKLETRNSKLKKGYFDAYPSSFQFQISNIFG